MNNQVSTWEALLPDHVDIVEVGPRDGFQNLVDFIDTSDKVTIIESLISAGIKRMEVTSFVHPKAVPQMRDAGDVMTRIKRGGCECFAMAPNLIGAERAIEAGTDMLNLVVSASDTHNNSNVRMTVEESLNSFVPVFELAEQTGTAVRASVATSFGCPFEGDVPLNRLLNVCARLVAMGCIELNPCDTTGMANPRQVAVVARELTEAFGDDVAITMHFHNTRGAGPANLLAALQNGVTSFESSLGGLGGCPFAPGATGNVCTEDMVHMLHEMEIDTGIDLERLLEAVKEAEERMQLTFPGQVIKAGLVDDLHQGCGA